MKAHELFKVVVASIAMYAIYEGSLFVLRGVLYATGFYQVPSSVPAYEISRGVLEIFIALLVIKFAAVIVNFAFPGCYKESK